MHHHTNPLAFLPLCLLPYIPFVDASLLRKRVWRRIVLAPTVLVPVAAGVGLLGGAIALGPIAAFAGVASCLLGVGMLGTRALTKVESLTEKTMEQMRREELRRRELLLDGLDAKLQTTGETRDEFLLRDLRVLIRQFEEARELRSRASASGGSLRQVIDVESKSERLFESCVRSLERSYELWITARQLSTPAARTNATERREKLLREVEVSVQHLGTILEGLHSLQGAEEDTQEMARIRGELDRTLESAKRVEDRMRDLDAELLRSPITQ
jgi:hypothetical protein